ncbi:MAG: PQQ-like beta-propeller repeat protein [Thermoplasmatales archaeon]|nr:MAG: PQQ-like beta-propeller repeat protein [Thermoplasmatales archaeon]
MGIAVVIIALFIVSAVSPIVIGFEGYAVEETAKEMVPESTEASGLMDSAWPMYQHDAANTGLYQSSFPDSFTQIWHAGYNEDFFAEPLFFSSPVIANGKVFQLGGNYNMAKVFAMDENNGSLIWKKYIFAPALRTPPWFNTPAFYNKKLFICIGTYLTFISRSKLIALDENTGDIIWKKTFLGTSSFPSVTVAKGKVIVGGHLSDHIPLSRFYVFNETNGKCLWKSEIILGFLETTPVVSDNKVFAATGCLPGLWYILPWHLPKFLRKSRIYAFDINDGNILWMKNIDGHVLFSSPSATNEKLFIPSNIIYDKYNCDCRISVLNLDTGEEIWSYTIEHNWSRWPTTISTPSIAYGKAFVIVADGRIFALDEDSGDVIWKKKILKDIPYDSFLFTPSEVSPVVADGKIICQAVERGIFRDYTHICMFNESNGELIWDLEIQGYSYAPFAVANEKLFMHKGWDAIYAFG